MKRVLGLLAIIVLLFTLASCQKDKVEIAIVQLGTHTSLDEINQAITSKLEDNGYNEGDYEITQHNANFSNDTANQIMQILKNRADVVVAIATSVAQAAYNVMPSDTPIVFAAVSDPVAAGLMTDVSSPNENVTGTSDEIQIDLIIDKALEIDPDLKKLGFIYNPNEDNSVSNKNKIEAYCQTKNIEFVARTIQSAGEMSEVANVLVSNVDAVLVTDDNTVASAMSVLGDICVEAKKPCYTGADSLVKDGGMLCVGINYQTLGEYTADMVIEILNGKAISEIPVKVFNDNLKIYLNEDFVKNAEIVIPNSILEDENLVKITK